MAFSPEKEKEWDARKRIPAETSDALEWGMPCGGMKMRNENQVGVKQKYQPSKKMTTSKKTNALGKRK